MPSKLHTSYEIRDTLYTPKRWDSLLLTYPCSFQHRIKSFGLMNRQLRKHLTINGDFLLEEDPHHRGVLEPALAECGIQTHDPEGAEITLLAAAIFVRMLPGLHHGLLRHDERLGAHAAVALGKLADLCMTPMTDDTSFYTHGSLSVGSNRREHFIVYRTHHERALQILLAPALLLKQVTAATALEGDFACAGAENALLGTAVRFELGHWYEGIRST